MTLTAPPSSPHSAPDGPSARPSTVLCAAQPDRYAPGTVPVVGVVVLVIGLLAALGFVALRIPQDRTEPPLTARILVPAGEPVQAAVAAPPAGAPRAQQQAQWRIGNWTPERGQKIAERALRWLDWPYSFGGGNAQGPTYGVPVDHASRNDGSVRGFDCSGLVLYALAPYLRVDHLASSQYRQTGTVHPSLSTLMPGDLVFWSYDGSIGKVHHVAIYVGDGKVVQAPQSGSLISITPIRDIDGGTIGTVRPLT